MGSFFILSDFLQNINFKSLCLNWISINILLNTLCFINSQVICLLLLRHDLSPQNFYSTISCVFITRFITQIHNLKFSMIWLKWTYSKHFQYKTYIINRVLFNFDMEMKAQENKKLQRQNRLLWNLIISVDFFNNLK